MKFDNLKLWAKEKRSGHLKDVLLPYAIIALATIILSQSIGIFKDQALGYYLLSFVGYFVIFILNLGATEYMIDFIKERELKIEKVWSKFTNITDYAIVYALQSVIIFIFSLLFIVPGVIKALGYALVPFILIDEENNLKGMDVLKKSEELMDGHKMDLFMLLLSFIGWHLLGIMTCGIFEIFVIPYQQIAIIKFISDIKDIADGKPVESVEKKQEPAAPINAVKFCTSCGTQVSNDTAFCPNCGAKIDLD